MTSTKGEKCVKGQHILTLFFTIIPVLSHGSLFAWLDTSLVAFLLHIVKHIQNFVTACHTAPDAVEIFHEIIRVLFENLHQLWMNKVFKTDFCNILEVANSVVRIWCEISISKNYYSKFAYMLRKTIPVKIFQIRIQ